jgi:tetrahydromethanopterin S-methyltransferase subunit D
MLLKLRGLSVGEGSGIPGVAVKCVDIGRNTGGEGGSLAYY